MTGSKYKRGSTGGRSCHIGDNGIGDPAWFGDYSHIRRAHIKRDWLEPDRQPHMNRPDSPPPRQPSPDILPAPLPYPRHPRRIHSQPKIKIHPSPALPPGLRPKPARSYDFLRTDTDNSSARKQTQSILAPSSTQSTPCSSRAPSVKNVHFAPTHRRTLSVAFPSPPSTPSPAPSEHSLTVPYRYTGPRHIVSPQPVSAVPIVLPDLDLPRSGVRFPPAALPEDTVTQAPPALERHKSMGMACLKFFGIRSPARRPQTRLTSNM